MNQLGCCTQKIEAYKKSEVCTCNVTKPQAFKVNDRCCYSYVKPKCTLMKLAWEFKCSSNIVSAQGPDVEPHPCCLES